MPESSDIPAGVSIEAREGLKLLTLRGKIENAAFPEAVTSTLGVPPPVVPNTAVQTTAATLLWLSPDAWLAVTADEDLAGRLTAAVEAAGEYVLDTSHGRAAIRLCGEAAPRMLAETCRLDLHAHAFAVDACVQTPLMSVSVLLHRSDEATFDLYIPRSYSDGLLDTYLPPGKRRAT